MLTPSLAITKASNEMSKLFYGKGVNSRREHKTKIGGKHTSAYRAWHSMLVRCYCATTRKRCPTYSDCSVDSRFQDFQDFADWYENHEFSNLGYQLDKDLLFTGNKIYSPDTCCFVPPELNNLILDHGLARGDLPQGVDNPNSAGRFRAKIKINNKQEHLGYFHTPEEAYEVYREAKERYVKEKALEWQDQIADNVFQALMNWTLDS